MNSDLRAGINWAFWIPLAMVSAIIIGMVMYYGVLPTIYNQETKAVRNSNQYITSKQDLMLNLINEYYELESDISELKGQPNTKSIIDGKKHQQVVIIVRVQSEANKLQAQYIPETVSEFLQETK